MYIVKTKTVFGVWFELSYQGKKGEGATFNSALHDLFNQLERG